MPTEKPKIIFVMEEDLLKRIDDFRFDNRINSRSEAIRRLIEEGLNASDSPTPKNKEETTTQSPVRLTEKLQNR